MLGIWVLGHDTVVMGAQGGATPAKRPKLDGALDPGEGHVHVDGQKGKNIVEMNGKSCLHEVAWPPGTFVSGFGSHGRLQSSIAHVLGGKFSHGMQSGQPATYGIRMTRW